MADNNNKIEAGFVDIPNGESGSQRIWYKDVEARAAIQQLDPASVIEVADVTALSSAQVEGLVVGGSVNKSDSTGKHSYRVTYKGATGCCLTYSDAENVETVAYDKIEGTWTFTDKTVTPISHIPTIETDLAGKQDTISDLSDIRSNASAGAALVDLVPTQATEQNQLADKEFVNSSISTATATYRGNYNLVTDLELTTSATEQQIAGALATEISTADNNDYCFVQIPTADATPTEIARIDRYKYDGTAWSLEYSLNNSGYTAAQWAAINSNITSGLVMKLSDLPTNTELTSALGDKVDKTAGVTAVTYDSTNGKFTKTINGTTTDVVTLDSSPTQNSKAPVTSGGVYAAIQAALINPISDSSITAASAFARRDCVNVDGTMYLCDNATTEYPKKTPVYQDSKFVTVDGKLWVDTPTASANWHSI